MFAHNNELHLLIFFFVFSNVWLHLLIISLCDAAAGRADLHHCWPTLLTRRNLNLLLRLELCSERRPASYLHPTFHSEPKGQKYDGRGEGCGHMTHTSLLGRSLFAEEAASIQVLDRFLLTKSSVVEIWTVEVFETWWSSTLCSTSTLQISSFKPSAF